MSHMPGLHADPKRGCATETLDPEQTIIHTDPDTRFKLAPAAFPAERANALRF
jgi:hypothetical protein